MPHRRTRTIIHKHIQWVGLFSLLAAGLVAYTATSRAGDAADPAPVLASAADTQTVLQRIFTAKRPKDAASAVYAFYAARDFRPVWTGSEEARTRAARALFALRHADRQGLSSADYLVPMPRPHGRSKAARAAAAYDVALTDALFRYAHDVSLGRVAPYAVYKDVRLPIRTFNVGQALGDALDDDGLDRFFADLPPPHPEYGKLVAALAHYRAIAEAIGGWHALSAHPSQEKLVARLDFEDPDLAKIANPSADDVSQAMMRFQARHGIETDGKLGPATLRALNVPISRRVKTIIANLERWRWLPRHFEDRYIAVNVPAQSVAFMVDGKAAMHSKAVVGRKTMPTPILRAQIAAVIANPPWDIPDDIAAKTILPHLKRDANYLKTRNMTLVDAPEDAEINWRKVKGKSLPYQIQELPGPNNALGQVMFDMPNDFYVYLHGTPNQDLFARDDREISHGCVRVENVAELAALTLSDTTSDAEETVSDAIGTGATQRLALDAPTPVYMLYWTASAEPDGTAAFFPDRYDRDKPLIAALDGKVRAKEISS